MVFVLVVGHGGGETGADGAYMSDDDDDEGDDSTHSRPGNAYLNKTIS